MKAITVTFMLIAALVVSIELQAQETGALIINPKIGGFAQVPLMGGDIVRIDTIENWSPKPKHMESFTEGIEKPYIPAGALVTGMVPDPSRGWAVAVTHDEEEFRRALPEYRRLIAEGKRKEAREVLHVSTSINVSTKVEKFRDREKIGDLPEEIGTFFFSLGTHEFEKYGGYLTFLSYTPDPDNPVAGIGTDIGETIHGILQVETTEGKHGFKFGYTMKIIMAHLTDGE